MSHSFIDHITWSHLQFIWMTAVSDVLEKKKWKSERYYKHRSPSKKTNYHEAQHCQQVNQGRLFSAPEVQGWEQMLEQQIFEVDSTAKQQHSIAYTVSQKKFPPLNSL